jgi:hypothetical protein
MNAGRTHTCDEKHDTHARAAANPATTMRRRGHKTAKTRPHLGDGDDSGICDPCAGLRRGQFRISE